MEIRIKLHTGLILSLIPGPSSHHGIAKEETCVAKKVINTKNFLPLSCPSTRPCRHKRNMMSPNIYNLLPDCSSWPPPLPSPLRYNTRSTLKFLKQCHVAPFPLPPFLTSFSMLFLPFFLQWNFTFFLMFTFIFQRAAQER